MQEIDPNLMVKIIISEISDRFEGFKVKCIPTDLRVENKNFLDQNIFFGAKLAQNLFELVIINFPKIMENEREINL